MTELTDEEQADIWAGHALQGMLSNPKFITELSEEEIARHCYGIVDSMMAERRRRALKRDPTPEEVDGFNVWWRGVQEAHWKRANQGNPTPKELPGGYLSLYRAQALPKWVQWTRAGESVDPTAWCATNGRPHFKGCGCNFAEQ